MASRVLTVLGVRPWLRAQGFGSAIGTNAARAGIGPGVTPALSPKP
jgi:hypothetical protein